MGDLARRRRQATQEEAPAARGEARDNRAWGIFSLFISGLLLLLGAGMAAGEKGAGQVLGILWVAGGLGGIAGWMAAIKGSRRWSRLVYLMILGFPLGTVWALGSHGIRWGCLDPKGEATKPLPRPDGPIHAFGVSFWGPRLRGLGWLAAVAALASCGFAVSGEWPGAGGPLLTVAVLAPAVVLWGLVPFSGFECAVGGFGLTLGSGGEAGWDEVSGVMSVPLPGFPFLWVRTRGLRPSVCVPLFLADLGGFVRAVRKYAPADHPLRSALARLSRTGKTI